MSSYKNKSKEELITALESLTKLNNSLVSSAAKDRIEYDMAAQQNIEKGLQFKKLSENLPDLIFQFTRRPDGSYFVPIASEGIKNIFGCSPEDVVDDFTPISKVIYPEDSEKVTKNIEYSAKYLTNFVCEFRVQLPGKEVQWILFKSIPKKLPDGSITWSGFNANITEQKKAEELLVNEKRRLSDILKGTNTGTWEWNIQTGETTFNERWAEIIGYTLAEISPMSIETWKKFMHPDDLKKSKALLKKHFNGKLEYYVFEGRMKHKNGNWIWVLDKGKVHFRDKDGNPLFMSGTHQDITERKESEQSILSSKIYLDKIINSVASPIFVKDDKHRFCLVNDSLCSFLNLKRKDLIGKTGIEHFPDKQNEVFFAKDIEVLKTGKGNINEEFIKDGHGNIKTIVTRKTLYTDANGNKFLVGVINDITENKKTEEKLKEGYALLRIAEEKAKLGGWSVNLEDNICKWSDEVAIIHEMPLGYSPPVAEGIGFYAPEWRDKITKVFTNCAQKGIPYDEEMQIITASGKRVWARTIGEALKDSSGKIIKVQGAFQDITERKSAEEALRESKTKLKRILVNLQDAYLQTDLSGNLTFVNPSAVSMYGYDSINEMLGLHASSLYSDKKVREQLIESLSISGKIKDYVGRGLKKDGSSFWVSMSIQFVRDNNDQIVGTEGVVRDITERKQTEDQIQKLSQAVEQSPVSIIITDTLGNIEYANPKTLEITGYKLDELIGKNPKIFSSGEKSKSDYKMLWKNIISGKEWRGEFHNIKKNGELFWELASISPIQNEKGEITHYLAVKEDITENKLIEKDLIIANKALDFQNKEKEKRAAELLVANKELAFQNKEKEKRAAELLVANKELAFQNKEKEKRAAELLVAKEHAEESDRLKSAFLANMSHEIRTPMNGILGFAGLLKEPGISGEKQQQYLKIIEKSGDRMLNIINDIVDISKIESGLMEVYITETDINEKIENLFNFFKPEADAKNIQFSVEKTLPENEAIINTDSEKIQGILSNLIKNAIKFTDKGEIKFGVAYTNSSSGQKELKFFVKDTGFGIPKDRQKAIFERFIQADVYDKMAFQGAGLGLSISKAYVEMLGGKIWVESDEGIGSVFYFTIPCNRETKKIIVQYDGTSSKTEEKAGNLKILIAEDDEYSEMFLSNIVERYASEILIAKNGFEAVEICRKHKDIDLILMDIQMPILNGYEATHQIRQFNKDVVIIAQTAFALSYEKQKTLDAGCNDYIPKPIKIEDLKTLIQKYLN